MAYDLEEQESIDQLKAWWEKWGTPVTAVVCFCWLERLELVSTQSSGKG